MIPKIWHLLWHPLFPNPNIAIIIINIPIHIWGVNHFIKKSFLRRRKVYASGSFKILLLIKSSSKYIYVRSPNAIISKAKYLHQVYPKYLANSILEHIYIHYPKCFEQASTLTSRQVHQLKIISEGRVSKPRLSGVTIYP